MPSNSAEGLSWPEVKDLVLTPRGSHSVADGSVGDGLSSTCSPDPTIEELLISPDHPKLLPPVNRRRSGQSPAKPRQGLHNRPRRCSIDRQESASISVGALFLGHYNDEAEGFNQDTFKSFEGSLSLLFSSSTSPASKPSDLSVSSQSGSASRITILNPEGMVVNSANFSPNFSANISKDLSNDLCADLTSNDSNPEMNSCMEDEPTIDCEPSACSVSSSRGARLRNCLSSCGHEHRGDCLLHTPHPHHHHSIPVRSDDGSRQGSRQGWSPTSSGSGANWNDTSDSSSESEEIVVEDDFEDSVDCSKEHSQLEFLEHQLQVESDKIEKDGGVLIFVYGTLKRGYCNHYNLETNGIAYFQNATTLHPYVLYMDSTNRSRPCLSDGSACPIGELVSGCSTSPRGCAPSPTRACSNSPRLPSLSPQRTTSKEDDDAVEDLVCPFCCFRQQINAKSEPSRSKTPVRLMSSRAWGLPVTGELYRIDQELLPALDQFERVPSHYVRQTIPVKGLHDDKMYHAEVYFNNTTSQRWSELLDGRFRLLKDYTLDHHKLYKPRSGNQEGWEQKQALLAALHGDANNRQFDGAAKEAREVKEAAAKEAGAKEAGVFVKEALLNDKDVELESFKDESVVKAGDVETQCQGEHPR